MYLSQRLGSQKPVTATQHSQESFPAWSGAQSVTAAKVAPSLGLRLSPKAGQVAVVIQESLDTDTLPLNPKFHCML